MNQFLGRWRVALRFAARDAARHKMRTALILGLIAIPVAFAVFLASLTAFPTNNMASRVNAELGPSLQAQVFWAARGPVIQSFDLSATRVIDPQYADPPTISEMAEKVASAFPNRAISYTLSQMAQIQKLNAQGEKASVLIPPVLSIGQADLSIPAIAGLFPMQIGRLPGENEIAVADWLAAEQSLNVGDQVLVTLPEQNKTVASTIAGIIAGGPTMVLSPASTGLLQFPEPESNAQIIWYIYDDAPVTWDDILTANQLGLVVFSREVALHAPPSAESLPSVAGWDSQTWLILAAIALVTLAEMMFLIGPAFAVSARRAERNLAIIAANGGTKRTLNAAMLAIGVVAGVVAASSGLLLGLIAAAILLRIRLGGGFAAFQGWQINPLPLALIWLVGVLLATVAAWLPARRAARVDVVAALNGRRNQTTPVELAQRRLAIGWMLFALSAASAVVIGRVVGHDVVVAVLVIAGIAGLLLTVRSIISRIGDNAGRFPLSWRFAFRDAVRNYGRTAPAISSVLVATILASAALVVVASQNEHQARTIVKIAAPNVVLVSAGGTGFTNDSLALSTALVGELAPQVTGWQQVEVIRFFDETDSGFTMLDVKQPQPQGTITQWIDGSAIYGPIVANWPDSAQAIQILTMLGIADPVAAQEALSAGKVIVAASSLADDGMVAFRIRRFDHGEVLAEALVTVPAIAVTGLLDPPTPNLPIVPLSVVAQIEQAAIGLPEVEEPRIVVGGMIGDAPGTIPRDISNTIQQQFMAHNSIGSFGYDNSLGFGQAGSGSRESLMMLSILITAGALVLALAAAWIATALAATESQPDLATMVAVGAAPRVRKQIVGAQAGIIAATGALVGILPGVAFGIAFVFAQHTTWESDETGLPFISRWPLDIPWLALAALVVVLPLLAVAAARLVTRASPPLTRRLAG